MRRRILGSIALVIILLAAGVLWYRHHRNVAHSQAMVREASYSDALKRYATDIKPGMTREVVERYLRQHGKPFRQMCCMGTWQGAYDDLVQIGSEPPPWYCSAMNVYIGFAFAATVPTQIPPEAHDTDSLTEVRMFRFGEGCL